MTILVTARLRVRVMNESDAAFMLALLNDPSWLSMIGDRGVRTESGAREYIRSGPMASQASHGFSFYIVELLEEGTPVGMCGLAQRDYLDVPDIGFAFLPQYCGRGYAFESAAAVLEYALKELHLPCVLATTRPYNSSSAKLLARLGMRYERRIPHPGGEGELMLFCTAAPANAACAADQ